MGLPGSLTIQHAVSDAQCVAQCVAASDVQCVAASDAQCVAASDSQCVAQCVAASDAQCVAVNDAQHNVLLLFGFRCYFTSERTSCGFPIS